MIDLFLADDLSGALDAAAAFHGVGRRVRVVLSPDDWTIEPGDDVIGVTTETRNEKPGTAARVVTRALEHARRQDARLVYKKIDSTLRGPVAAELEALAQAMPEARILFAPANPAVGRIVRDGVLLVNGVPVTETEFARDPLCPVRESRVANFAAGSAPARILIPNTETAAELAAAVDAMAGVASSWVAAGSGALARPVAAAMSARPGMTAREARPPQSIPGAPVLLVGGSAHPINRTQAAAVARVGGVAVRELQPAPLEDTVAAAAADLASKGLAVVVVEAQRGDSAVVLEHVTRTAVKLIKRANVRRVFVTGGETAFALGRQLGITSLLYIREVAPGLGLARAQIGGDAFWLAVKPGGFGDAHTWEKAWAALSDAGTAAKP